MNIDYLIQRPDRISYTENVAFFLLYTYVDETKTKAFDYAKYKAVAQSIVTNKIMSKEDVVMEKTHYILSVKSKVNGIPAPIMSSLFYINLVRHIAYRYCMVNFPYVHKPDSYSDDQLFAFNEITTSKEDMRRILGEIDYDRFVQKLRRPPRKQGSLFIRQCEALHINKYTNGDYRPSPLARKASETAETVNIYHTMTGGKCPFFGRFTRL